MKKKIIFAILCAAGLGTIDTIAAEEKFESYAEAYDVAMEDVSCKEYKRAIGILAQAEKMAKTPEQKYRCHYRTADIFRLLGDKTEALNALQKAATVANLPANLVAEAHARAGMDLETMPGKEEQALAEYAKAVSAAPQSASAFQAMRQSGMIHLRKRRFEKALPFFKAVIDGKSSDYQKQCARLDTMKTLVQMKRFADAEKMKNEAATHPGMTIDHKVQYLFEDAAILRARNEYDKSLNVYQSVLQISPLSPDWTANTWARMAEVWFYGKKNIGEAKKCLEKSNSVPGATWGKNAFLTKIVDKASVKKP